MQHLWFVLAFHWVITLSFSLGSPVPASIESAQYMRKRGRESGGVLYHDKFKSKSYRYWEKFHERMRSGHSYFFFYSELSS